MPLIIDRRVIPFSVSNTATYVKNRGEPIRDLIVGASVGTRAYNFSISQLVQTFMYLSDGEHLSIP